MKSLCLLGGLLVFNVYMPFMRKGFCNMFLEECLMSFKAHKDEKKYICFVRNGVCNMYGKYVGTLLNIDLVYIYFVRHGV